MSTSTLEQITPDTAREYLSKNTKNRTVKELRIVRYARDMEAGKWLDTGEAIKFDRHGNMIDGQNRCHAIIRSGVSVEIRVVRGLDPEAQEVMDAGAPRSAADALNLRGVTGGKDVAAVAAVHHMWNTGGYPTCMTESKSYMRMTTAEITEYVDTYPELIEATAFAKRIRSSLPLPVGSTAVAYDEFVAIDGDVALDFFARITEMRMSGKGDPVATLVKRVNDMRADRGRIFPATGLFLLMRTWNALRTGERLQKLPLGSKENGWAEIPNPK